MRQTWIAPVLVLFLSLPVPALATEPDSSLRIGTFNAYMLPDQGILIAPVWVGPNPVCAVGELTPTPPLLCEVGNHPVYDSAQINAGAKALAQRIIASGYDVIALNEVFDGSAQGILKSALWDDYPYSITYVDEWGGTDQDSGLQLFSKFPFLPITPNYSGNTDYNDFDADVYYEGVKLYGKEKYYMAFMPFGDDCEGDDCWSNKGVGYVRLQNPSTRRIHHVYFTHMQATYKEDVVDDPTVWQGTHHRKVQFDRLKTFFEAGIAPATNSIVPSREDVFVMGDLNVEGDLSNSNNTMTMFTSPWNNKGEWTRYFNSNQFQNGFFSNNFDDTWAEHHPLRDTMTTGAKDDFGITHGDGDCLSDGPGGESGESVPGCRWDYILYNAPMLRTRALCNQHPSLGLNLLSGKPYREVANHRGARGNSSDGLGGTPNSAKFVSDHTAVNGNFNVKFEQCSPLLEKSALAVYGPHPTAGKSYGAKTLTGPQVGNNVDGSVDFGNPGQLQQGVLTAPGSVQWWRVTEPGAYLIGFWDDGNKAQAQTSHEIGYRVQVFQSGNLSVPVKDYKGEIWTTKVLGPRGLPTPVKGPKYILSEPPYYIKVYHPKQQHKDVPYNSAGHYWFGIHRLNCTNKAEESCPVIPSMLQSYQFPLNQVVPSYPTPESLYFNLHVQQLTVPDDQDLQFIVSGYNSDVLTSMVTTPDPNADVPECDGPAPCDEKANLGYDDRLSQEGITTGSTGLGTLCPSGTGSLGDPHFKGCNNVISWTIPQPPSDTRELFWKVTRTGPLKKIPFSVTWTTDLTAFFGDQFSGATSPIVLHSHGLTDDVSPHDEIHMSFKVDGVQIGPSPGANGFEIGDYSEDMDKILDGNFAGHVKMPIRFKHQIELTIIEYDDVTSNEETVEIVGSLDDGIGPRSNEKREHANFHWDDGHYEMGFNLSRGTQSYEKPDP